MRAKAVMASSSGATVPIRCGACGQQTHKTLESIAQNMGFLCACGANTELDLGEFEQEIEKSVRRIRDFGRDE